MKHLNNKKNKDIFFQSSSIFCLFKEKYNNKRNFAWVLLKATSVVTHLLAKLMRNCVYCYIFLWTGKRLMVIEKNTLFFWTFKCHLFFCMRLFQFFFVVCVCQFPMHNTTAPANFFKIKQKYKKNVFHPHIKTTSHKQT